ncbi:MAG: hypothetical protein ABIS01_06295 [Ferruginibacter sp.]
MIKQLRKRHFQIWSAMLILIPTAIIAATLVIPKYAENALLQPQAIRAMPVVINTVDKEDYTVNLRSNSKIPTQVEWINKKPLTVPTAVIYKTIPGKKDIENADLIGRIESGGPYYFDLKKDSTKSYYFILYDFIHKKIIDSLNLTL